MAWIGAAIAAVGGVLQAKEKAKASQNLIGMGQGMQATTDARTNEAVFDNSGWNVSFGSSKIDSTASKSVEQAGATPTTSLASSPYGALPGGASISASLPTVSNQTLIYVAIAGLMVIAWKKKKS